MPLQISDQILFSSRFVWNDDPMQSPDMAHFGVQESLYRWIPYFLQPDYYTQENRKTIQCFRNYLSDRIGRERFNKICSDVDVDFDELYAKGVSLTERDVSKIFISCRQISRNLLLKTIEDVKRFDAWTRNIPSYLRIKLLQVERPEQLDLETFHELYHYLEYPFENHLTFRSSVDTYLEGVLVRLVYFLARFVFDKYLFIKDRVLVADSNPDLNQMAFFEKMGMFFSRHEEMEVGMILKGSNYGGVLPTFYRLAGKLISANGQLCMFFVPAIENSTVPPLRVTRGTAFSLSGIDAISYFITDFEEDLGRQGFDSGEPYERFIDELRIEKWIEIGYSAGGGIAQWRAAHHPEKVSQLWTFRSVGIPERVNALYLDRIRLLEHSFPIYVTRAAGDFVDYGGDCHLGLNAPENVDIRFLNLHIPVYLPHFAFGLGAVQGYIGYEGGFTRSQINHRLNNKARSFAEDLRKLLGGKIVAPILIKIRDLVRYIFGARAELQKGLWIENRRERMPWNVKRIIFSPDPLESSPIITVI